MAATLVSFVLCLIYPIYLAFLPFHAWALAVLIGIRVRRFPSARSVPPDPAEVKVDLPERAVSGPPPSTCSHPAHAS
jgi:hypothetical protein